MRPRDDRSKPCAGLWMQYAEEDLGSAQALLAVQFRRNACFHAQQAAEKALKAYLATLSDEDIPRTHDTIALSRLVVARGGQEPPLEGMRLLNQHAVLTRYPSADQPTEAETAEAILCAEGIVAFVRRIMGLPQRPTPQ